MSKIEKEKVVRKLDRYVKNEIEFPLEQIFWKWLKLISISVGIIWVCLSNWTWIEGLIFIQPPTSRIWHKVILALVKGKMHELSLMRSRHEKIFAHVDIFYF